MKKVVTLREGSAKTRVIVHMGTCGIAAGARPVMSALVDEVDKRNLSDVQVGISSCAGLCSREPMITVEVPGKPAVKYVDMTGAKAIEVLDKHVLGGRIVTEYALAAGSERVM
jgi:NADP-reducing hydrogenase subunit HndB